MIKKLLKTTVAVLAIAAVATGTAWGQTPAPAGLAWSADSFTGYSLLDFNNWAPTLANPNNVEVRYGCAEGDIPATGGIIVDVSTGVIGTPTSIGYIHSTPGTYHIYAVHDATLDYMYDSVVYTLTVERGVAVTLMKNIDEGGTVGYSDYGSAPTLTNAYSTTDPTIAFVAHGHTVDVEAEADTGYHFVSWGMGNLAIGYPVFDTTPEATATIPNVLATGVMATFDTNVYDITCTAQTDDRDEIGSGLPMGVVTLGGRHMHFLDDTLTATANYGYIFSGWYAADTLVSEDNPYIFSPVENSAYEARFVPDTFTVSAVPNIETAAEISDTGRYAYLTNVTVSATPATGYQFVNWTDNAGTELGSGTTYTLQVLGDSAIIAVLDTNVYTVTATVNIEGLGTVTGAGQVKHFMSTTLMAAAHVKYHFVNWINDAGDEVGSSAGLIVFPVSDTTLTAVFDTNIYATVWSGNDTTTYTSHPYTGLTATYTDFWGNTHTPTLTFVCGDQTIVTPNYPVTAGTWTVTAVGDEGDSLTLTDTTLVINPAIVNIVGVEVETAKFADGSSSAVVTNPGSIYNVQGSDVLSHTTVANFNNADPGIHKTIFLSHTITADDENILENYTLTPAVEVYTTEATIIETITPDTNISGDDTTLVNNGIELYAYGYCTGSSYQIKYHLNNGQPDQYKIDFADSRFTDVPWTSLTTTGLNGTIDINVPVDIPTGDYTCTLTFGDSRFAWLESAPITLVFHVNLPETFTMPLFNNVIALVDTCQCFTDIQWYHRPDANSEWYAIPGATGYYYHATDAELNGEFFVKAKYNGVETYTCPQTDMETLLSDTEDEVNVKAYPNPTTDGITLTVSGSTQFEHTLRVISTVGAEMENRTFEGPSTTIDMRNYRTGIYMVSVDGVVVRVIRN